MFIINNLKIKIKYLPLTTGQLVTKVRGQKVKKDKLLLARRVRIWSGLILNVSRIKWSQHEGSLIKGNQLIYLIGI